MVFTLLMALANPMTWLVVFMLFILWARFRKPKGSNRSRGSIGVEGAGGAFQFLSIAYRPNHAFLAKAQVVQVEDTDEDDQGGPDTPLRHFHRQLRRIRQGKPVERLIWRRK